MNKTTPKKYLKDWKIGPLDFWDITFLQVTCIAFGMFLALAWDYAKQLSWHFYLGLSLIYFAITMIKINKKVKK